MQVYVLCDRESDEILAVYADAKAIQQKIAQNVDKFYCVERTLLTEQQQFRSMLDINKKEYDPLHYKSAMPFGKYKGKMVGEIVNEDPSYLQWCMDNLSTSFDEEVIDLIKENLQEI